MHLAVFNEYMCRRGSSMLEDSLKNVWNVMEVQAFF